MASFLPKSASLFLLTAFCFLSLSMLPFQSSDRNGGSIGCVSIVKTSMGGMQQEHRKLLVNLENNEMVFKNGGVAAPARDKEKKMEGSELRAAPLGPDPLHHHGGSPKPRITP